MRAQIELLQNAPIAGVEQHDIVGEIVGDQQPVAALARNHGQSGGIRNRGPRRGLTDSKCNLLAGGNLLRRDFQKAFRSHFAIFKFVHCDAVAGIASLRARGIGDRAHRRVKMAAVGTESETEEITLMGGVRKAGVGKIVQLVGAEDQES